MDDILFFSLDRCSPLPVPESMKIFLDYKVVEIKMLQTGLGFHNSKEQWIRGEMRSANSHTWARSLRAH